ncbi:MAG: DUF5690 family protein [Bacteroidota bacterium]
MIKKYLQNSGSFIFICYAVFAAFGTYFCMYAFRKPFSVGTYESVFFWGNILTYKSAIIISQVIGYALSKFIGIKVISELKNNYRAYLLIGLILLAETALVLFGFIPAPWNIVALFLNGLPLGMIWGIVFSYLEGRRFSEILGAGLAASFIVASGAVKSVGKWLMLEFGVPEFWMPAATGALFIFPLFIFAYLLEQIPPPTGEDQRLRTERLPMDGKQRKKLFLQYAPGIIALVLFYTLLTAYRDFRDNFAAEIWTALGFGDAPAIFTIAEIPIAVLVLIMMGATMLVRNNIKALQLYFWIVFSGALIVGLSTLFFTNNILNGAVWMMLVGLGLYIAYVPFNCILFDRMIAAFQQKGNAGFLIYVADAFGYLGSVLVLLYKDFVAPELSWLEFFTNASYLLTIGCSVTVLFAIFYFRKLLN